MKFADQLVPMPTSEDGLWTLTDSIQSPFPDGEQTMLQHEAEEAGFDSIEIYLVQ